MCYYTLLVSPRIIEAFDKQWFAFIFARICFGQVRVRRGYTVHENRPFSPGEGLELGMFEYEFLMGI
jgi:hypothetical protein